MPSATISISSRAARSTRPDTIAWLARSSVMRETKGAIDLDRIERGRSADASARRSRCRNRRAEMRTPRSRRRAAARAMTSVSPSRKRPSRSPRSRAWSIGMPAAPKLRSMRSSRSPRRKSAERHVQPDLVEAEPAGGEAGEVAGDRLEHARGQRVPDPRDRAARSRRAPASTSRLPRESAGERLEAAEQAIGEGARPACTAARPGPPPGTGRRPGPA